MRKIKLTQGKEALVDDADYDVLMEHKWHAAKQRSKYRVKQKYKGKTRFMHQLLTGFPLTDHIDGNPLNNQRHNLREATTAQNCMNRGTPSTNTSGYKGVYWDKSRGRWRASIKKDEKTIQLGRFDNKIDAAKAYDKAARELHGEFCYQNFPEEQTC